MVTKISMLIKAVLLAIILAGCATIPMETIELSHITEENIIALRVSYIALINAHFDLLESIRIEYLENKWIPGFIERWVIDARLADIATGAVVWSEEQGNFMQPEIDTGMDELLPSLSIWAMDAIDGINEKKDALLSPLKKEREELLSLVEEGFGRLLRANMTITSHLNSVRNVQEYQKRALEAFNLSELLGKIDRRILGIPSFVVD